MIFSISITNKNKNVYLSSSTLNHNQLSSKYELN